MRERYNLAVMRTPGKRWHPHLGANKRRSGKRAGKRYWSRKDHKPLLAERAICPVCQGLPEPAAHCIPCGRTGFKQ